MATMGQVEITNPSHNSSLMQCLHTFTTRGEFTDLCFICSDKRRVFAHKLLLCTVSSELKTIISELPEGLDIVTIHLPDVDSFTLKLVIDFVYEGYMRLTKREFDNFQSAMKLLGIILKNPNDTPQQKQQQQQQQPPSPPLPPPPPAASSTPVQHHVVDPQMISSQQQVVYVAPGPSQGVQYVVAPSSATNHIPSNIQPANQMSNISTSNGQIIAMAPNQIVGIVQNQSQMGRTMGQRSQVVAVPQGSKIVSQGNQVIQQGNQIIRLVHSGDQIAQPQNQVNNIAQPANIQNVVRVVQNTSDLNIAQNRSQVQNTGYVNSSAQQVRGTVNQNMPQNVVTSNHYQVVSSNSNLRNNQTVVSGTMPAHTVTTMSNYGAKQTRMQQPSTSGSSQQQNLMQYLNRTAMNNMQQQVPSQRRRKSSLVTNDDVIMIDDRPDQKKIQRINR